MTSDLSNPLTIIGLMSGTSVDAIDACCVKLWQDNNKLQYEILATHSEPIDDTLTTRLLNAMEKQALSFSELCHLNKDIGFAFGNTVNRLLETNNIKASDVDYISSHGQTIYHEPPRDRNPQGVTLQIGDTAIIKEITGIKTIADFRPHDMAVNGQGAPLICLTDKLLFASSDKTTCVQNIGGIANVTVLPKDTEPFAFDTGPGNMLIDAAVQYFYETPYDTDGTYAAQGKISPDLLAHLKGHDYLKKEPPKTTGREAFGVPYFGTLINRFSDIHVNDMIATLTAFTAETIVDAYEGYIIPKHPIDEIIFGGGGVFNNTLMQQLKDGFHQISPDIAIKTHDDYGIPDKYKESLAFAILGWTFHHDMAGNIPSCTGARKEVILGKLSK